MWVWCGCGRWCGCWCGRRRQHGQGGTTAGIAEHCQGEATHCWNMCQAGHCQAGVGEQAQGYSNGGCPEERCWRAGRCQKEPRLPGFSAAATSSCTSFSFRVAAGSRRRNPGMPPVGRSKRDERCRCCLWQVWWPSKNPGAQVNTPSAGQVSGAGQLSSADEEQHVHPYPSTFQPLGRGSPALAAPLHHRPTGGAVSVGVSTPMRPSLADDSSIMRLSRCVSSCRGGVGGRAQHSTARVWEPSGRH